MTARTASSIRIGDTYGRWEVIAAAPKRHNILYFLCRCECGKEKAISGYTLVSGNSQSCGCGHFRKHGMWKTPEYKAWQDMKTRCNNPKHPSFAYYGARGITYAPEWEEFSAFIAYIGPRPFDNLWLDRIDNDGNYEPGNVRWTIPTVQLRNRRNNKMMTYGGETRCLTEWAEIKGIDRRTLYARINTIHMTIEDALNTPVKHQKKKA